MRTGYGDAGRDLQPALPATGCLLGGELVGEAPGQK